MRLKYLIFAALIVCTLFTVSCGEHEHSFGEWSVAVEPSCTETGRQTRVCADCGAVDELEIAALGHSLTADVTDPTCTERGYTHYECEACDYESDGDYVEPTGHTLVALSVTEPTCTSGGFTHFKCSVCESESDGDFVDMLEHSLVALAVTEPTCTERGFTHYGCENCDYEKDDDYVKETGHDHKATRYYPTISTDGYTAYICHCGDSYEDNRITYGDIFTTAYTDNTQPLKRGVDVSKWNHQLSWESEYLPLDFELLKSMGVEFVIIRAGHTDEDGATKDPTFEMNYAGAKAAGLEVGVYFYTYATTMETTLSDARTLLEWLEGKQLEYPVYLDVEDPSLRGVEKTELARMCAAFVETVQRGGYYGAIYANNEWLNDILGRELMTSSFDIWYARYPLDPLPDSAEPVPEYTYSEEFVWDEEKYGKQLGMWQFTACGKIEGFDCYFDLNYAYKDYGSVMKQWGLNGF